MNKIERGFHAISATPIGKVARKVNINHLYSIEDVCMPDQIIPVDYQYQVKIHLGMSMKCQEADFCKVRDYIQAEVNHYVYGEVYGKLLELRNTLWQDNIERSKEIVEELLTYTRGEI